jgi:hypothetical protein
MRRNATSRILPKKFIRTVLIPSWPTHRQEDLQVIGSHLIWWVVEIEGVEPTNNADKRALRTAVIQGKIKHGVQSSKGALSRSRLLTVTSSVR